MLRIVVQRSSAGALGAYFAGGRGDYYAEGLEVAGEWGGQASERLGLKGEVTRGVFEALCRNERPGTGEPLTPRTNGERRVGYDFTFNCPKSVSVLYGLTGDREILGAFERAVRDTMRELERLAETRVRRGGEYAERRTENLLYATFVHTTARPVNGYPDPHLHAHNFVFNATWDEVEGRWKAMDLAEVKRNAPYFEAAFHARLAREFRSLGFDVAPTVTGWEVAGIPERMVRSFSRRTDQIEARAKELGITDARAKDELGAMTRDGKRKDLSLSELRELWRGTLSEDDLRALDAVVARDVLSPPIPRGAARRAVAYAVRHSFERQSVVPLNTLLASALRYGVGEVTVDEVREEAAKDRHGLLIRERDGILFATTLDVLREESRMLAFAREGKANVRAVRSERDQWGFSRPWLTAEQKAVVRHVLHTPDRVLLVRGAAGTGKTALMQEATEAIRASGKEVVTLAPSADASRGVLRSEGFQDADTVARFLVDETFREKARGHVVWVDEAGLLGTRTLAKLFDYAAELNARVVLSGDTRQHASVERGAALRLLETEVGLTPVEVTSVRRQKGRYKEAVEFLSTGRTLDGFDVLDGLGWVKEVKEGRESLIAAEYVSAVRDGKKVLVVSPTHSEGRRITEAIRVELRGSKLLGTAERTLDRLESKQLTEAERSNPLRYREGDVIEFSKNAPAFQKGSRYAVVKAGRSSVVVRDRTGTERILPFKLADRFEVYTRHELKLAPGERVRITRNGKAKGRTHNLDNGAVFTVRGFTPAGDIELSNGAVVAKEFGHLGYGYVATSHASQGKTVDRVIVAQSSESFPASSREQLYVSTSRAKEAVTVYTDDKAGLRRAVQRSDPRTTATELLKPSAAHPAWLAWMGRRAREVERLAGSVLGNVAHRTRLERGVIR